VGIFSSLKKSGVIKKITREYSQDFFSDNTNIARQILLFLKSNSPFKELLKDNKDFKNLNRKLVLKIIHDFERFGMGANYRVSGHCPAISCFFFPDVLLHLIQANTKEKYDESLNSIFNSLFRGGLNPFREIFSLSNKLIIWENNHKKNYSFQELNFYCDRTFEDKNLNLSEQHVNHIKSVLRISVKIFLANGGKKFIDDFKEKENFSKEHENKVSKILFDVVRSYSEIDTQLLFDIDKFFRNNEIRFFPLSTPEDKTPPGFKTILQDANKFILRLSE
tara:strand:- start:104 stop:937 length:834 start_codon:yes stop_codon:yes gene_type:complete